MGLVHIAQVLHQTYPGTISLAAQPLLVDPSLPRSGVEGRDEKFESSKIPGRIGERKERREQKARQVKGRRAREKGHDRYSGVEAGARAEHLDTRDAKRCKRRFKLCRIQPPLPQLLQKLRIHLLRL